VVFVSIFSGYDFSYCLLPSKSNFLKGKILLLCLMKKQIKSALISVFYKDNLEPIIKKLAEQKVTLYSTGGTQAFIEKLGVNVIPVEELTSYPSILGGRVKTLHPKIFGGILSRRELASDVAQLEEYNIPPIDLVIVDLYPFEETLAQTTEEAAIIEKIDIGGISLIRAGAKNFKEVVIVPSKNEYAFLYKLLNEQNGVSSLEDRKYLATQAFSVSSRYDAAIQAYFAGSQTSKPLRYGENPHQKATFHGSFEKLFTQIQGKELSYNNILDVDAAIHLMAEFYTPPILPTFAILKHNNACGIASRPNLTHAWKDALAADPLSAFGGVLIANTLVDELTAAEIHKLFFEVIIAPEYSPQALDILKQKQNRIILRQKQVELPAKMIRTALNGYLEQDRDSKTESVADLKSVTTIAPSAKEANDVVFANKIVKHTKSNTIVLVKDGKLLASGVGQTSRVDALKQAIAKAKNFGFDLKGSVMASDAFFPFPDCVQIAHEAGIAAVVQPGGSIKDKESIDYCNANKMAMVCTGIRHFKH
jgi:phosphoribosylaminoimidazolecarboxamide formyltransferase / IMP cyclohydrolase